MKEKYITENNINSFSDDILEAVKPFERMYDYSLEKDKIALVLIDMQQYFFHPDAHGFIPSARAIIPNVQRLQNFFLNHQLPVILTQHINNEKNAGMMGVRWKEVITADHPFAGIVDEVDLPGCKKVKKAQFDAFFESDLEDILRANGITQLIITGVMANLCCETTVRSAFVRGFEPFMPVDATAAYNYNFHLGTFQNLAYGFMQAMSTAQIIQELEE